MKFLVEIGKMVFDEMKICQ